MSSPRTTPAPSRRWLIWGIAALIGAVLTWVLHLLDVPSQTLFGGLATGVVVALSTPNPPVMPRPVTRGCQAVLGASIGATFTIDAVHRLANGWLPAVLVTLATLLLSVLCGVALARFGRIGTLTGVLAMIAGGASTITSITRELGADERIVAVVQYVRVVIILATLPPIALLLFHAEQGVVTGTQPTDSLWHDLLFTAISVTVGAALGKLVPVQTFFLLGPMVVASVIAIAGWLGVVTVPSLIVEACFVLLGLQVGLRFTRESLRTIARLLVPAALMILVVIVGSGLLGWLLHVVTGVSTLTAYLATTPGGLPAVLAIATSSNADATYVFAVQMARLLLVLILAPIFARFLSHDDTSER